MLLTLRQARLVKGLTQREMAESLGIHVQTYSKMEKHSDDVTIGEAKKICKILDMSYDSIFFNQNSTLSRYSENQPST